jgi:hypothetical protein
LALLKAGNFFMSTSFRISGSSFDRPSWEKQLQLLLRGEKGWVPLRCMDTLYPKAKTEPISSEILLIGKGSSRGVYVHPRLDRVSVELMVLSSVVDWDVARWLLAQAHKLGAEISDDEGVNMGIDDFAQDSFASRRQKIHRGEHGLLRGVLAKDDSKTYEYPVAHMMLRLSRTDLESLTFEEIHDSLVKQCFLYGNAVLAKRMEYQAPDGTGSIGFVYRGVSMLAAEDVQWVIFSGPDGIYADTPVPIENVREILATFITPVGRYLHFPVIEWDKNPALLEALTGKTIDQINQSLDDQFRESILQLPVLAFTIIAKADGEIEQKEARQFMEHLRTVAADESDQTLFAITCRQLVREMKQVMAGISEPMASFEIAVQRLNLRMSPEGGMAFKKRLFELCEMVAKASGGGFFGLGAKVSDAEKNALSWIQGILFPPAV